MAGRILVGTASWADPGFIAAWYPRNLPASDRLPYYAARFNFVELNSSFYAVPNRRLVTRWCSQTPPGFVFNVKLHRLLSRHSTTLKFLPSHLRSLAKVQTGKVVLTPELEKALTQEFLNEISPLREAGKLGALLLQLTPAFSPPRHTLEELEPILDLMSEYRVAIELRNRRWVVPDQVESTVQFFRRRRVTFVSVDAPEAEHFMAMPELDVVTAPPLAYLRLHGRNLKGFVSGKTVAERFDYLYTDDELQEIAARTAKLASKAAETHVVYNNNSSDYALRNAATFRDMLGQATAPNVKTAPGLGKTLEFNF